MTSWVDYSFIVISIKVRLKLLDTVMMLHSIMEAHASEGTELLLFFFTKTLGNN